MSSASTDRGQVLLAVLLVEAGAGLVVVGSTARYLRGGRPAPRDLDVVVHRDDRSALDAALAAVAARPSRALAVDLSPQRFETAWSPVDVFVEDVLPTHVEVDVDGVRVRVADE